MRNRFAFPSLRIADGETAANPAVEPAAHLLSHEGCQLHYWLSGPRSAPVVVLIHGEGANHHSFDAQVQVLARSYRVLTWDIRGHGQSRSERPFTLHQAVDDLHAILAHENYAHALLVGVSVGGLIAQLFAHRFPDFVHGLALLSCTPLTTEVSSIRRFFDRLAARLLRALPFWLIMAQFPARLSIRSDVQRFIAEAIKESGKAHFVETWQAKAQVLPVGLAFSLPQSLLVAYGAYDRQKWIKRARTLWFRSKPDIHLVVVPGAGHHLTQDNPSYTSAMLNDFLYQCARERHQPVNAGRG